MKRHHAVWMACYLALCVAMTAALRVEAQTTAAANAGPQVTTLAISPAAMAAPALQYRLLPPEQDIEPGNAAPRYLMALTLLPRSSNENDEQINGWLGGPLSGIDESAATQRLAKAKQVLAMTAAAARTGQVNWEIDLRREGMRALLPHLSPLRKVANLLALAIRLDIKHHQWADARDKLQTGFALARHLGEGETLIESMVGIGIAMQMEACLETWVQEPGSPNVFWPVCNVPTPFNTLLRPVAMEQAFIYFDIPALRDFAAGRYSVAGWYTLVAKQQQLLRDRLGADSPSNQVLGLAVAVADYPQAKAALVSRGASPAEVERRPVAAVLEEFFMLRFSERADDLWKWSGLPAYQVIAAEDSRAVEGKWGTQPAGTFADLLGEAVIPSLSGAELRTARLDRRMAMLRIVEALRAYQAEKGALPESLGALSVPLPPMDPVTGKPFEYSRDGNGATIASPAMADHKLDDVWHVTIRP